MSEQASKPAFVNTYPKGSPTTRKATSSSSAPARISSAEYVHSMQTHYITHMEYYAKHNDLHCQNHPKIVIIYTGTYILFVV